MSRPTRALLAAGLLGLALSACSSKDDGNASSANVATAAKSADTLYDSVSKSGALARSAALVESSGLDTVLKGKGPYTIFLPTDAAIDGATGLSDALEGDAMRPQRIAFLTGHIVPGYMTVKDLNAALDRAKDKPVKMATMAGGTLSFARADGGVSVTGSDGAKGMITGEEVIASNGAIHAVDGLLVKAASPAAR